MIKNLATMRRPRRGVILIYAVIILVALMGLASLAVDFGRVAVAKTQLQNAADAAARAAAVKLSQGYGTQPSIDWALEVAARNPLDSGQAVLDIAGVSVGNWSDGTFYQNQLPINAVMVSTTRSGAQGNAVPLLFGQVIGARSCDIAARAVATFSSSPPSGVIALNGIAVKNNAFMASYDSRTNSNPTQLNCNDNAALATNGPITGDYNNVLLGRIVLGPSGSVVSGAIEATKGTSQLAQPIATPPLPDWTPAPNPGGVPQNYTVNSNVTLPGGTYWFTSLTISKNKRLSFSGPATLIVNGPIVIDGELLAADRIPGNLVVQQLGNNAFGDSNGNHCNIVADIVAPGVDFVLKNTMTFRGKMTFGTITLKNSADFFYDEAEGPALDDAVTLVE